jgi:hypothetical protein
VVDRVIKTTKQHKKKHWTPKPDEAKQPVIAAEKEFATEDIDDENISDDASDGEGDAEATSVPSFTLPVAPPAVVDIDAREYQGSLEPLYERQIALPSIARLEQFLLDPALAVKAFLSHEYQNRGLYWEEWYLYAGPIAVLAFLEFFLRHQLLPDDYTKPLREAVDAAKHAKYELPRTKKAAMALRDKWGTVCVNLFGSIEEVHWGVVPFESTVASTPGDAAVWGTHDEGYITEAPIMAELIETNDIPVSSGDVLSDEPRRTPARADGSEDTSATQRWGSSSTAGDDEISNADSDAPYAKETLPTWDAHPPPPTMFQFVGCSTFPMTHAPVRAERSVRAILATFPPMDLLASTHANPISLLHSKLGRVVLGPWKDAMRWEGDLRAPEMLRMELRAGGGVVGGAPLAEPSTDLAAQFWKPGEPGFVHDPLKDNITVFVDPEIIDDLTVGLGVTGIFVQVAKRLDAPVFPILLSSSNVGAGAGEGGAGAKKKKPYGGANKQGSTPTSKSNDGRSWWYIESVTQIIPSFWTETTQLPLPEGYNNDTNP